MLLIKLKDKKFNFRIMEEQKANNIKLNPKLKSQFNYGLKYSKKISELKIFIHGLRGVIKE